MVSLSVCIATFNGERHIEEQLESVLLEIDDHDEVIIVDDASSDSTVNKIVGFKDPRIVLLRNRCNSGPNEAFSRAIGCSKGEIIIMADQDDIWVAGRVSLIRSTLRKLDVVASNIQNFKDASGERMFIGSKKLYGRDSSAYLSNIIGIVAGVRPYFGCAMGFRSELKEVILPIPKYVESHDLWIALAGNILQSIRHHEEVTVLRRIHENNVSLKTRGLFRRVLSRLISAFAVIHLLLRSLRFKRSKRSRL